MKVTRSQPDVEGGWFGLVEKQRRLGPGDVEIRERARNDSQRWRLPQSPGASYFERMRIAERMENQLHKRTRLFILGSSEIQWNGDDRSARFKVCPRFVAERTGINDDIVVEMKSEPRSPEIRLIRLVSEATNPNFDQRLLASNALHCGAIVSLKALVCNFIDRQSS